MSSDLQPTPMSQFNEVTNITNFNDDSKIPFLDANATSNQKINAIIKYKNFRQLIVEDILPIDDSQIITSIDPNNINVNLLTNVSQIQVNKYGRITKISGNTSTSTAAISPAIDIFQVAVNNDLYKANPVSTYKTRYTGKILITGFCGGTLAQLTAIQKVMLTSNIKTTGIPLSFSVISTTNNSGKVQTTIEKVYISSVITCSADETNWLITAPNALGFSGNLTFFNYQQIL